MVWNIKNRIQHVSINPVLRNDNFWRCSLIILWRSPVYGDFILYFLSDCNETRTHNHLVCKQTLNHLAKLVMYKITFVCLSFHLSLCLCVWYFSQEWVITFFLLFCMKEGNLNSLKLTELFFLGKFIFAQIWEKRAQNRLFWILWKFCH